MLSLQSQLPARPVVRQVGASHRPLQPSLSLPLDSYYQPDHSGVGSGDSAFQGTRLPAPGLVERRTQSIGDASATTTTARALDAMHGKQAMAAAAPARYKTELCRPYEENGTCRYDPIRCYVM